MGQTTEIVTRRILLPGEEDAVSVPPGEYQTGLSVVLVPPASDRSTRHVGVLAEIMGSFEESIALEVSSTLGLRTQRRVWVTPVGDTLAIEDFELPEPTQHDLNRLTLIRGRLARAVPSELSPGCIVERQMAPENLLEVLEIAAKPNIMARVALIQATTWKARLDLLVALTQQQESQARRLDGLPVRKSRKSKRSLPKLPSAVQKALEQLEGTEDASVRGADKDAKVILTQLVWTAPPSPPIDIDHVRELLDESHFGLDQVKNEVLDYLSILEFQRRQGSKPNGASLCLVGPPGVGKTSIAQTIADVTGRTLEVIPMGGATDIGLAGATKTFNRARPGEIIRRLHAGKRHPSEVVFLLDEIDKAVEWGDHSVLPVLLALLDPSQHSHWRDAYLEVPIDLSSAIFLATANNLERIAAPLRDRLRVIQVPAYSIDEQVEITRRYLEPRLRTQLGVDGEVTLDEGAVVSIVRDWPHAAGCRQIEQRLGTVVARALRQYLVGQEPVVVTAADVREWVPKSATQNAIGFSV